MGLWHQVLNHVVSIDLIRPRFEGVGIPIAAEVQGRNFIGGCCQKTRQVPSMSIVL